MLPDWCCWLYLNTRTSLQFLRKVHRRQSRSSPLGCAKSEPFLLNANFRRRKPDQSLLTSILEPSSNYPEKNSTSSNQIKILKLFNSPRNTNTSTRYHNPTSSSTHLPISLSTISYTAQSKQLLPSQ